jgi:hypothetical protein
MGAAWRHLHAAWTCDDTGHHEDARSFRLDALRLFEFGRPVQQEPGAGMPASVEVLLADIARRAGMFERARASCESGMRVGAAAFVRKLLALECRLFEAKVTGGHTVGEVEQRASDTWCGPTDT